MNSNINFKEEVIISVHEQKTNRNLERASLILIGLSLFLAVTVFGVVAIVNNRLDQLKTVQANLISQINKPENKKKELLYFLTKNRLSKLSALKNLRVEESPYLDEIININKEIEVVNLALAGRVCELVVQTDDYQKFVRLLENADQFGIIKDGIIVSDTSFQKGKYKITIKFSFKE